MLDSSLPFYEILFVLDNLNASKISTVFIFIGNKANQYVARIDKDRHEVRDIEPFFYNPDVVNWNRG